MSCNCPNTNSCPTANDCLCGINISLYLNDVLTNSYESGGYIQGGELFFDLAGTDPLNKIRYSSEKGRWELYYFSEEYDQDIVIGVYYTDSLCPISNCDWDLDCISFIFRPRLNNYVVTWDGEYINGRKSYTIYGSVEGFTWTFYWDSGDNRWELIADNPTPTYGNAYNTEDIQCVPTEVVWSKVDTGAPSTYETFPLPLDLTGYDMKISAVECGCCDESVVINITVNDVDYSDVVAEVVKDQYGNILGVNGNQYYLFELPLIPDPVTFYLYYTGTSWIISNSLDEEGNVYVQLVSNNDCPFGFYSLQEGPVSYFNVKGTECFDCCDYYAPRNRNLLKKKKAIFVDEISSIRNKEIFGLKCGPEWSDLFKKHLIFDVLWCLPYGVLCDDDEQCLINNLNENCNC